MSDLTLFPLGEPEVGDTPRHPNGSINYSARAQQRIKAGRHPLMYPAPIDPDPTHTCGNCEHLALHAFANRYLKCDLADSGSAATDVRRRWPGCPKWEARHD